MAIEYNEEPVYAKEMRPEAAIPGARTVLLPFSSIYAKFKVNDARPDPRRSYFFRLSADGSSALHLVVGAAGSQRLPVDADGARVFRPLRGLGNRKLFQNNPEGVALL